MISRYLSGLETAFRSHWKVGSPSLKRQRKGAPHSIGGKREEDIWERRTQIPLRNSLGKLGRQAGMLAVEIKRQRLKTQMTRTKKATGKIAGSAELYFIWLKREEQRESANKIKVSEWLFPSNQDVWGNLSRAFTMLQKFCEQGQKKELYPPALDLRYITRNDSHIWDNLSSTMIEHFSGVELTWSPRGRAGGGVLPRSTIKAHPLDSTHIDVNSAFTFTFTWS